MSAPTEPAPPSDRERAFVERTRRALGELAERESAAHVDAAFRGLAARRIRWGVMFAAVLVGAALAATVTGLLVPEPRLPSAFDGGLATDRRPGEPTMTRDAQGRLTEIVTLEGGKPVGERVLFRAGRVVRIEHWQGGQLDGVATDFDGSGRVTRIETWRAGRQVGPSIELDPQLAPRRQGTPP